MAGDTRESAAERRNVDTFKLAVHRTELANRRTLMAYVKTTIALCASSLALLKFLDSRWLNNIGWILLVLGGVTLLIGFADYHRVRKSINDEKRDGGL